MLLHINVNIDGFRSGMESILPIRDGEVPSSRKDVCSVIKYSTDNIARTTRTYDVLFIPEVRHMKSIILASGSPRRKELLDQVGIPCTVDAPNVDESMPEELSPYDYVEELSKRKALAAAGRHPDSIVLAADTIVALGDRILGKPADSADAYDMLRSLSGRIHSVYTGVTIIYPEGASEKSADTFHVRTDVKMYDSDDSLIRDYAYCGEPLDKAGAYGIQGRGAVLVEKIDGDYSNVKGLPVAEVYRRLYPILKQTTDEH